ncbi:MAG TPA: UDP-N-acetylglucosamine 2-epimerase [Caldisericia bacterium]|nr:UDP-N-acetylglucosamine 2-epimerase [Caldisericia bacterium]
MTKIKVAFFISARSEYGLLRWTLKEAIKSEFIEPVLYVGGGMLSTAYGMSINELMQEFSVDLLIRRVPYLIDTPEPTAIAKSLGIGIISLAQLFQEDKIDLMVILGDRYDTIIPSTLSTLSNIPIMHICGGDVTEGAIDDQIRNSLTKLSHIHLVQTPEAAKIVSSLGEEDWRIVMAGAPGVENIRKLTLLPKKDLYELLSLSIDEPVLLCTYHPVTLESAFSTKDQIDELICALKSFKEYQIVMTYPGVESESNEIIERLREFEGSYDKIFLFDNLGSAKYLALMKYCQCVVGNSSSGIIEAPSLKVPTLNIGTRQQGRVSSQSVIHCGYTSLEIINALNNALSDKHVSACKIFLNPYELESELGFSQMVVQAILKMKDQKSRLLSKKLSFEVKTNEWNTFLN